MLRFSDRFKQETARWLGLRRRHIESVVRNPDDEQRVELGGDAHVRLVRKLWDDPKKPRTWIVALSNTPAAPEYVFEALPIPSAAIDVEGEPLDLFRRVCERVGLQLRAGDHTGRFIERARVRLGHQGSDLVTLVDAPTNVGIRLHQLVNVLPPYAYIAFAYAFPEDALTRFILARDH